MISKRELERRVAALEERCELLDSRCKDLLRMLLFLAKEARVLDPGLCERSMWRVWGKDKRILTDEGEETETVGECY